MFNSEIAALQARLAVQANPQARAWWQGYVKDSAPFLGVKMPVIRSLVRRWHRELLDGFYTHEQQVDLALSLITLPNTEEKLAGALYLQEILLPAGALRSEAHLDEIAGLFTGGAIYDWNVCDWFCVKVLGPLIEREGQDCAGRIAGWRDAPNLWQARASLVAFVKVADQALYYPLVEKGACVLIRREERFAKTAVGWILREISRYDLPFVRQAIEDNLPFFSAESLKNASKYFSPEEQKSFLLRWKEA